MGKKRMVALVVLLGLVFGVGSGLGGMTPATDPYPLKPIQTREHGDAFEPHWEYPAVVMSQTQGFLEIERWMTSHEKDYIIPTREEWESRKIEEVVSQCIDCPQSVLYRSFEGDQFELTQYTGKNVRLLLPDKWVTGLTVEERRVFLDRADTLYEHFRELIGSDPVGEGKLTVAIVSPTCDFGCGYIGWKGVEIDDSEWAMGYIKPELSAGFTPGVLVHEMTHNFDVFHSYLHYLPDHAHAWTDFMQMFISVYSREGTLEHPPDEFLSKSVDTFFRPYSSDLTRTWATCVRDGLCEDRGIYRNNGWGGVLLRYSELHGPEAVRGYLTFLRNYKQAHPFPSASAEAREDINVAAMAAGVKQNLSCYVDEWSWYASSALRSKMRAQYGSAAPFCSDNDGDGYSVLAGDCDDTNRLIHPDSIEVINGVDDNCNGVIDDLLYVEPDHGDFLENPMNIAYPAEIYGKITDGDSDRFRFQLKEARNVRFVLRSNRDFQGWLFIYNEDGSWFDYQYVWKGGRTVKTYNLEEVRWWTFSVDLNAESIPGKYAVQLFDAKPWPWVWGFVDSPEWTGAAYSFSLRVQDLSQTLYTPTSVRFWVTGHGFVGSVPYSSWTTGFQWIPPAGITSGIYGVRAQLFSGVTPVSDLTTPRWFNVYTRPPTVTTGAVSSITQNAARGAGVVISDGGASVTARGVCWSTSPNPTTGESKTMDGVGTGAFISSITGLIANTKYYVRAYASNSTSTAYGNQVVFDTAAPSTLYVNKNGHCGGFLSCYQTIQEAMNAGSNGYTIKVCGGLYREAPLWNRTGPVTMSGGWNETFTSQIGTTEMYAPRATGGGMVKVLPNVKVIPKP